MVTKPRFFDTNFYYHVYNCGVDKRLTFLNARDYERFMDTLAYYLYDQAIGYVDFHRLNPESQRFYRETHPTGPENKRVKISCHCLMPNHFHFLLKPVRKEGITLFLSDITNSHTRYFNIKNGRFGALFQGPFKSKAIDSEESLLQVSRYIHINPNFSSRTNPLGTLKVPEDYPYSSYGEWLNVEQASLVDKEEVRVWLERAGGIEGYREFVLSRLLKGSPSEGIEDLILEA